MSITTKTFAVAGAGALAEAAEGSAAQLRINVSVGDGTPGAEDQILVVNPRVEESRAP